MNEIEDRKRAVPRDVLPHLRRPIEGNRAADPHVVAHAEGTPDVEEVENAERIPALARAAHSHGIR